VSLERSDADRDFLVPSTLGSKRKNKDSAVLVSQSLVPDLAEDVAESLRVSYVLGFNLMDSS
jgi:hypothetical protein